MTLGENAANSAVDALESVEALDGGALKLAGAVSNAVPVGVPRDALSGTWLGHALHPLLTDVVIGSFLSATLLDLLGGDDTGRASERLIEVGLVTAAPTVARRLDPVPPRQPRRTGPASEAVLEREGARGLTRRRAPRPRAHLAADRLRFRAGRAHGCDVRRRRARPAGAPFLRLHRPGRPSVDGVLHLARDRGRVASRMAGVHSPCRSGWRSPSGSPPRRSTASAAARPAARSRSPSRRLGAPAPEGDRRSRSLSLRPAGWGRR